MKFNNESGCAAELFKLQLESGRMGTALLGRVRHRLGVHGELLPFCPTVQLPDIRRDRCEDSHGAIEPDLPYPRTGTDVIVLADALSRIGPTPVVMVGLEVGPYAQELLIFGDRTWQRRWAGLRPSDPQLFERMPLTYQRAYGGRGVSEHGPLDYPANPAGKGFYLDAGAAEGSPLPNIEDPRAPIALWTDRPVPVGCAPYPSCWSLRVLGCVDIDDACVEVRPDKGLFDRAHPKLSGKQVVPGDRVRITGTSFAPVVEFVVPACPFEMILRVGEKRWYRDLELEELLIDLRDGSVEFSYRKLCSYAFVPHQRRETTLRWCDPEAAFGNSIARTLMLAPRDSL